MISTVSTIGQFLIRQGFALVACGGLAISVGLTTPENVQAQTFIREGKLQLVMLQNMASDQFTILSTGVLRNLETDPFFDGDYDSIYNSAAAILDEYTPVVRGGFFPENAGIPRERQVTVDEAIYRLFQLDNGNELMLYRSPVEDTSRYFIRQN
ncbi:MAG: hypothetical protein AAFQ57_04415 [Cyanobacteria bacterium J06626_14]